MERSAPREVILPEPEIGVRIFRDLWEASKLEGYNFGKFQTYCAHVRHVNLALCGEIYDAFLARAERMVVEGTRTPFEAILWVIETMFPLGTFTAPNDRRIAAINQRKLFRMLVRYERRLYDQYMS